MILNYFINLSILEQIKFIHLGSIVKKECIFGKNSDGHSKYD